MLIAAERRNFIEVPERELARSRGAKWAFRKPNVSLLTERGTNFPTVAVYKHLAPMGRRLARPKIQTDLLPEL